jgi:hypothetical protein
MGIGLEWGIWAEIAVEETWIPKLSLEWVE